LILGIRNLAAQEEGGIEVCKMSKDLSRCTATSALNHPGTSKAGARIGQCRSASSANCTPVPQIFDYALGGRRDFMKITKYLLCALVTIVVALVSTASPQEHPIDIANSHLRVHAFKSGLFSGFADNHDVEAPIVEGAIDESASRVRFTIDAQRMKVLDPQLSPDKRRQVQERMLGPEVLDATRFPQINFQSTKVESAGQDQLLVRGQLSLRGVTRPVSASIRKQDGRYVGTCTLSQRDFGITPISIAGGTVKVKDELKVEFDIRAKTISAGQR